jgi:membrane peptidoglycan carboxypeptidase
MVTVAGAMADTGKKVVEEVEDDIQMPALSQKSYLHAADGTLLTTFYSQNRVVVGLDQISKPMQQAVIALEDRRFWEHSGVDVLGMARAFVNNVASEDDSVQGASTLTQQFVKNSLIERSVLAGDRSLAEAATDMTYARKLREAKMAVSLEEQYGKEKVLEGYLNIAQFGPSQWGVEAAASYYFGIHASELTVVQAATIAAVTQSPNGLDPVANPERNQARRDDALAAMLRDEYITQQEYDEAVALNVADTLKVTKTESGCEAADYPYNAGFFCDYVVAQIRHSEAFGKDAEERQALLDRGGLTITTTLDPSAQANAFAAVNDTVPYNDKTGLAQALAAVEPKTGRIVAMAQNRWYKPEKTDDPVYTSVNYSTDYLYGGSKGFQPGSTFKPFTLAAWLEAGHSLRESFDGSRTTYAPQDFPAKCMDGGVYSRSRSDTWSFKGGASKGVDAYTATQNSMNAAYVAMAYKLDLCDMGDLISRLGVVRADGDDWMLAPSMVLGSNEVSPLRMAAAYATFASGGVYCAPTAIDAVVRPDGSALELPEPECSQALDEGVANGVSAALKRAVQSGTGTAARLSDGRPVAGKTGTTDNSHAAWFCGYTPQLAAAIWTGYPVEPKKVGGYVGGRYYSGYGGDISAPTFKKFMGPTMEGKEKLDFGRPPAELELGKMVRVPNVVGKDLDRAKATLQEEGFSVATDDGVHHESVPAGVVVEQRPRNSAYPGSTITLTLSLGPKSAPQPE